MFFFLAAEKESIAPIGHLSNLASKIHLRSWNRYRHRHKIWNRHWHRHQQTLINNNRHRYQHRQEKWNRHITNFIQGDLSFFLSVWHQSHQASQKSPQIFPKHTSSNNLLYFIYTSLHNCTICILRMTVLSANIRVNAPNRREN